MRTRRVVFAALVTSALAACSAQNRGAPGVGSSSAVVQQGATKADEDSIRALGKRWNAIVARHDSTGWGAMFADDGKSFSPNAPAAIGPAGVTTQVGALYRAMKDFALTFAPTDITVSSAGDLAVERGTYELSFTDPTGRKQTDHGNYVTAWKKVNGQWKALADINASDVAPSGHAQ